MEIEIIVSFNKIKCIESDFFDRSKSKMIQYHTEQGF